MNVLSRFFFALCLGSAATLVIAAPAEMQPVPQLSERVTDQTGTLDAQQKQTLESELAALEQRKKSQIAVLLVATTQPEDIAQYAIRVFDQWKLGRKGVDDGVLMIVAKDDHRMRIEVGRGLEGAIPDAATARILREYVKPKFRAGDFYGGIHDATGALIKLVDGESLPESKTELPFAALIAIFFAAVPLAVMMAFLLRLATSFLPDSIRGIVVAIVIGGAMLSLMRWFDLALGLILAATGCAAFASFFIGRIPASAIRMRSGSASNDGSSFTDSDRSSSSSSDSSSSSSSDSFSGGGGESAGGGSSDSW